MKTRGLMLAAFLFSGTAFAQSTTQKTEQSAKVNVKAQSGNEAATVKGNTTVKSESESSASVKGNTTVKSENESRTSVKGNASVKPESESITTGKAALKKEISDNSQLLAENVSAIKGAVDEQANAAIETSNSLNTQTKQVAVGTTHQLKNTLNTSAAVNGSLMNATRIKTGPARINTQLISRSGLIIR